ncbi:MAG TPA: hypothetical protein VFJ82_03355 [Longimicrobium sp.]|nr:hypothetical protein [Longimicrobium sp.]
MLGRLIRWIGDGRKAARLRRRARRSTDPNERAELLLDAAKLDDLPSARLEAAVALAQAGRYEESAWSWRRAIQLRPLLLPTPAQADALLPVLPGVARDVLDGLMSTDRKLLDQRWALERRGTFDGEERWRLLQERHWEMEHLVPTLRYIALAVAHTSGAPGRLRIDCDRYDPDPDSYLEIRQLGEAIVSWDEARRITQLRVRE